MEKRKLRGGMVGGGSGSWSGAVHRMAATMDGQAELVAGFFRRRVVLLISGVLTPEKQGLPVA